MNTRNQMISKRLGRWGRGEYEREKEREREREREIMREGWRERGRQGCKKEKIVEFSFKRR